VLPSPARVTAIPPEIFSRGRRVARDAPFSAKRRPNFISVTVSGARFWDRSTLSNWFNLYGNYYKSALPNEPWG